MSAANQTIKPVQSNLPNEVLKQKVRKQNHQFIKIINTSAAGLEDIMYIFTVSLNVNYWTPRHVYMVISQIYSGDDFLERILLVASTYHLLSGKNS